MFILNEDQKDTWLNTIELDLTTFCNMSCRSCAHGCDKFPSKDYLKLSDVVKFVHDSIVQQKRWKKIGLMGGEPTLHPEINGVIEALYGYSRWNPDCAVWMMTNGLNWSICADLMRRYPWLTVWENNANHSRHHTFYVSPSDENLLGTNERCEALRCGVGLGPYGYTPCVLGTTMHRIFGYETLKTLEELTFNKCQAKFNEYCTHCGWYLVDSDDRNRGKIWDYPMGYMSETWQKMYKLKGE